MAEKEVGGEEVNLMGGVSEYVSSCRAYRESVTGSELRREDHTGMTFMLLEGMILGWGRV